MAIANEELAIAITAANRNFRETFARADAEGMGEALYQQWAASSDKQRLFNAESKRSGRLL